MRGEGLAAGLLGGAHPNLVVVAGPRLEPGWPALLRARRRGAGRLFTNCRAPAVGPEAAVGVLLTGALCPPGGAADPLWRLPQLHLGHLLARSHLRLALLAGLPAGSSGPLATGFDEVRPVPAGREVAALQEAAGRLEATAGEVGRPWFLFAHLHGEEPLLQALGAFMAGEAGRRTVLVVYDPGPGGQEPTRRTPLWLEHPGPGRIDAGLVLHPHLVSPLDVVPTLLGEGAPRLRVARGLLARGSAFRGGLITATVGAGDEADPEAVADSLLRLGSGQPSRPGRFEPVSFVVAVDDPGELEHNLRRTPLAGQDKHEWLLVDNTHGNYSSISRLYDDACRQARHDLVVFCHQDVHLPEGWEARFFGALADLEGQDPDWGIVGSVGVVPGPPAPPTRPQRRAARLRGHWADPGGHHYAGPLPHEVECLDEMWLALRRSRGIRFDRDLPGFHCYGMDLSLSARALGLRSYALDCFVWHKHRDGAGRVLTAPGESGRIRQRADEAFRRRYTESYEYVAAKWGHLQPFASTSAEWPLPRSGPGAGKIGQVRADDRPGDSDAAPNGQNARGAKRKGHR